MSWENRAVQEKRQARQRRNKPMRTHVERKHKRTTNALAILDRRYFEGKPQRVDELEEARANHDVAVKIRLLREMAGMTQAALAKLVRTTPSVICRSEDADYEDRPLRMFWRIAVVLDHRVEIRFVRARRKLV